MNFENIKQLLYAILGAAIVGLIASIIGAIKDKKEAEKRRWIPPTHSNAPTIIEEDKEGE